MKTQVQQFIPSIKRITALMVAVVLGLASTSGIVMAAAAGGQVQYRSIKLSDNGISGGAITSGVGSGTNVTYRVTFRAASNYDIKGVVLDFCNGTGGTPFIGDASCPTPTNFNIGASPVVDTSDYTIGNAGTQTTVTGLGTTSDWTTSSLNSGQTFKMVNSSGTAVSLTSGTDYTFAISGITNPSDLGTFYARLITYSSDTGDITTYTHSAAGNYQDYGGFALSTAQIVQVTAKVQETIQFCVSGTTDTTAYPATTLIAPKSCTDTQAPAITLGHGDNDTLDAGQIDRNSVWTIASTNALRGLVIRMHNSNPCGGLSTDNGATCGIPPNAGGPGVASSIAAGSAGFGMYCNNNDPGPLGTSGELLTVGNISCDANYQDAAHSTFPGDIYVGMDASTTADNVTSPYGDTVATSPGPISNVRNQYDFMATASNTTPAGIYKANLAMIATGTF